MHIGELKTIPKRKRKRVGRGPGSGHGKTSSRGHKGQGARSGFKRRAWFEGGQMPLQRRIPKRGFKSLNKKTYQLVNLLSLQRFDDGDTVDPEKLKTVGLIKHAGRPVKILGSGELTKRLSVQADAFSNSAREKIAQLGGEISLRIVSSTVSTDGDS
ncbi:MAG: 50S ribosomal protein L15 [Candidatus Omnitrophota bacterium]|jgi:large subunit ribosomal protein L15|nr:MAG: 50S ribosomal protein L15 [Candidatus Omnitrophota bacterium]